MDSRFRGNDVVEQRSPFAGMAPQDERNSCDLIESKFLFKFFYFGKRISFEAVRRRYDSFCPPRTVLGVQRTAFRAIPAPLGDPAGCVRQAGAGGGRVTHGGSVEPSRRKRQGRMAGSLARRPCRGRVAGSRRGWECAGLAVVHGCAEVSESGNPGRGRVAGASPTPDNLSLQEQLRKGLPIARTKTAPPGKGGAPVGCAG